MFQKILKKQVNVTAQSGGSVAGGGSYTISEYAKVTAEPETNYTFAGWYENNILISKEKEYRFCVQNNRSLSAHFSKSKSGNPETVQQHNKTIW